MSRATRRLAGAGTAAALAAASLAGLAGPADAAATGVTATLIPGGASYNQSQSVDVPDAPPSLDFGLIVDLSGSYNDDLPNLKSLATQIGNQLKAAVPDTQLGSASFVDYPFSPWGGGSDYAYMRNSQLSATTADFQNAINAMVVRGGNDEPESQYEAIYQAVTGAGRELPPPEPAVAPGEIAPGQGFTFRPTATKVIALTTDANFHLPGDAGSLAGGYPGPSQADVIAALQAAGVVVIGLSAPGLGGFPADDELGALAAATGGSVKRTNSSSSDIVNAILAGIQEITYDVTAKAVGCGPAVVSFSPAVREDVPAGTKGVLFDESYSVPTGTPEGTITCRVDFLAGDSVIDSHPVTLKVDAPPTSSVTVPTGTPEGTATAVKATVTGATSGSWSAVGAASNDAGAACTFASLTALSTTVTCDDDGNWTIAYTAKDGVNADATGSAPLAVGNVAPVLSALTKSGGSTNCGGSASIGATATDAGANDLPVGITVNWGDGSAPSAPGSHTYTSGGTFTATVTADDLDLGTDSDTATFSFNSLVGNGFAQPINSDGSSRFKIGSTIPVKTRIVTCAGLPAVGQTPEVQLFKIDSTPTGEVNEVVSSSAADSGRTMRDQGDGSYHYNLSTKLSQFCPSSACSNGNLTPGTYELRVVEPGMANQVVRFDLRT